MWGYGASSYRHGCRGQKTIIFSSVIQDSLYARCMQPVQVQMKTYWHRCSSPEPRNLYLHFQKIRKSHREIPTRTGKKMVKNICHGKFWEEKIPVLALSWIKAFLNTVSMGLWAIKPCKIEKQWPKKNHLHFQSKDIFHHSKCLTEKYCVYLYSLAPKWKNSGCLQEPLPLTLGWHRRKVWIGMDMGTDENTNMKMEDF